MKGVIKSKIIKRENLKWVLAIFFLLIAFGAGMSVNLLSTFLPEASDEKVVDTRLRKEERGCWDPLNQNHIGSNVCAETIWRFVSFRVASGINVVTVSYKTDWEDTTQKGWVVNYSFKFKDEYGLIIANHPNKGEQLLRFNLDPMDQHTEEGTFSIRFSDLLKTSDLASMSIYASFTPRTGSSH